VRTVGRRSPTPTCRRPGSCPLLSDLRSRTPFGDGGLTLSRAPGRRNRRLVTVDAAGLALRLPRPTEPPTQAWGHRERRLVTVLGLSSIDFVSCVVYTTHMTEFGDYLRQRREQRQEADGRAFSLRSV